MGAQEIQSAIPTDREVCVIDPRMRSITIPQSENIFGVTSDENSDRKYFRCPRVVGDNIDLSKMQIRINFQNASGRSSGVDRYDVEDAKVVGDNIEFSWQLSRKAMFYAGQISFSICAIEKKEDGMSNDIDPEWNTTLGYGTVLQGLELETQEERERGDDWLTQHTQGTATGNDLAQGTTAIVNGELVVGTLRRYDSEANPMTNNSLYSNPGTPRYIPKKGTGSLDAVEAIAIEYTKPSGGDAIILNAGAKVSASAKPSDFGNATAADVAKGKTFTSAAGLRVTGMAESSEGTTGKLVKTGTLTGNGENASTINTGLSSVEEIIIFSQSSNYETGIMTIHHSVNTEKTVGFGASKGDYLTTLSATVGNITISGGSVTYTPISSATSRLISGRIYDWIAIGK